MARKKTLPGLSVSIGGVNFPLHGESARQKLAELLATIVAPEATWESFNNPSQALGLAADYLAGRHGVDREWLQRCFDRIVGQACGGALPRGASLFSLFSTGPLSWPRRVFGCKAIGDPLRFLDEEDFAALSTRLAVTNVLTDPRTPLYSNRELGHLLADFAAHQESTKDGLLRDGHAATAFARSPWLDVWLNKLYPVKIPLDRAVTSPRVSEVPVEGRYVEGRRLAVPLTLQDRESEACRPCRWLERRAETPCPIVRFAWGRWSGSDFIGCEYVDADRVTWLHDDDVQWLDSIRPILHEIKDRTLQVLSAALSTGTPDRLWDRVVAVLADRLNAEQVQMLLRIDAKYLGYNAMNGSAAPGRTPYVPGGLSTIIELAGFVEKELEVGTLHSTREALGELVVPDLLRRPRLGAGVSDPYWALAGAGDGGRWRSALDIYAGLEARETAFWGRFRTRLAGSLETEIPQIVQIPVKPHHGKVMRPLLENQVRAITREIEDGVLSPAAMLPGRAKCPTGRFPKVEGLRWGEVTITFVSNDAVRIVARGERRRMTFVEMGFTDGRKGDLPDTRWSILHEMALHGGQIDWKSRRVDPKTRNKISAAIGVIGKRLQTIMQIDNKPFEPYRKAKMYKPKFVLGDESGEGSSRKKDDDD